MRTDYMDHGSSTSVYATGTATYDISAATVASASTTTPTPTPGSPRPGHHPHPEHRHREVDRRSEDHQRDRLLRQGAGKYVVKIKVGTEITQCYILHVIP